MGEKKQMERDAVIGRYGPWTAENIDLGDGVFTMAPGLVGVAEARVARIVQAVSDYAGAPIAGLRILDLGSYEGAFAIELARRGARVTAVEGRERHVAKIRFAQQTIGLDNLTVHHADVRSPDAYAHQSYDVVLCLGLLYHLTAEEGAHLLGRLRAICERLLVLETQIGLRGCQRVIVDGVELRGDRLPEDTGRGGASIGHETSFMPTRATLLNVLQDVGFSSVCEVMNPVIPTLAAYRDHVTLIARVGDRITCQGLPQESWPQRLAPAALPQQGLRWRLLEHRRRRRGGGIAEIFVKHPRG